MAINFLSEALAILIVIFILYIPHLRHLARSIAPALSL